MRIASGRPNPKSKRHRKVAEVCCSRCGKPFLIYQCDMRTDRRHYCSSACHRANRKGTQNPNWRGGRATKICKQCGKSFKARYFTKRSARQENRYCSMSCRQAAIRKYPDRRTALREYRRRREYQERASKKLNGHHTLPEWKELCRKHKQRCAHCGKRRKLCRDHIIPISKGGHDLITNIQPLCRPCNSRKGNRV